MGVQYRSKYSAPEIDALLDKISGGVNPDGQAYVQFKNRFEFPLTGDVGILYVAVDEYKTYIWNDVELRYISLEPDIINGGGAR